MDAQLWRMQMSFLNFVSGFQLKTAKVSKCWSFFVLMDADVKRIKIEKIVFSYLNINITFNFTGFCCLILMRQRSIHLWYWGSAKH